MYRSANVSAGRAGGRRWAQQHPPPAGARSADARAPPQVLLRSWSRLTRAPSYATPSRPDRTNCRKAFHWPHRPASSWYHFSWRNLHRRANADSLFGTNVEITPPSISNHFCYGTSCDKDRNSEAWIFRLAIQVDIYSIQHFNGRLVSVILEIVGRYGQSTEAM